MQFSKIDKELIDYVFDKSKLKQGHFTPGTNIKVRDPKNISRKDIDYLLILSWNIKKKLLNRKKNSLRWEANLLFLSLNLKL